MILVVNWPNRKSMSIKDLGIKYLCILRHPKWWFSGKNHVLSSKIRGWGSYDFHMEKSTVKKSNIKIIGRQNQLSLNNCEISNCNIFIRGEGHQLIVDKDVQLHNASIRIIGWNNIIHFGSSSTVGSGQIVCGGKGISIQIGKDCMFSDEIDIWSTDTHSVLQDGVLINEPKSIIIGDHVWCGKGVTILKGVTIGDNAVIGMRSLVTKDIRPATLNVGSPIKEIRSGIEWTRTNPNNE